MNNLAELDFPIHIVLTQRALSGQVHIIGVAAMEWRKVLHSGRTSTLVELTDQHHPQITVGIMDIILEFLPADQERARKDELEFHV